MSSFETVRGGSVLLNSGYRIPRVGLGISRIRGHESLDVSVRAALASGYRLFDTAHIYENEAELGAALEKFLPEFGLQRSDIFITTKVPLFDDNSYENAKRVLEESFSKLRTEYLDLVLIHYPRDRFTGRDENAKNPEVRKITWQLLEEYHVAGKIRSLGVSNYEIKHLDELLAYAKVKPSLNQCEYHPYLAKKALRAECDKHGIFFQAFSSLCWGNQEVLNEPIIKELTAKYNVTPQAVLYAFALNTNVGIIPKSATPARIEENIKAADLKFTTDEVEKLLALNQDLAFCPGCAPSNVI